MKKLLLTLLFSISLFASVGEVIFIKGDVFVLRGDVLMPAAVGMELQQKDTVTTRKNSIARILFEDKSAVSVGSGSEFGIESYFFDEKNAKHSADFKMQKGIFRMITGKIAKASPDKFKLKTKTATIGIRGTIFSGASVAGGTFSTGAFTSWPDKILLAVSKASCRDLSRSELVV